MFTVDYPADPHDEKQWTEFLDAVRNQPICDNCYKKTIALYYGNAYDTYVFIKLLDGAQIGKAMAAQLSKSNYKYLPTERAMYATRDYPKWSLFEMNFMVGKKECYELFMGNLEDPDTQNHYLFASRDEAQRAFEAGHEAEPSYNAYILRHYFEGNSPTSTTEYFPLQMP